MATFILTISARTGDFLNAKQIRTAQTFVQVKMLHEDVTVSSCDNIHLIPSPYTDCDDDSFFDSRMQTSHFHLRTKTYFVAERTSFLAVFIPE